MCVLRIELSGLRERVLWVGVGVCGLLCVHLREEILIQQLLNLSIGEGRVAEKLVTGQGVVVVVGSVGSRAVVVVVVVIVCLHGGPRGRRERAHSILITAAVVGCSTGMITIADLSICSRT